MKIILIKWKTIRLTDIKMENLTVMDNNLTNNNNNKLLPWGDLNINFIFIEILQDPYKIQSSTHIPRTQSKSIVMKKIQKSKQVNI